MHSARAARTRAIFGLPDTSPEPTRAPVPIGSHPLDQLLRLRPGESAYITGPSGSGKSTLLAALRSALRLLNARIIEVREPPCGPQAAIDCMPGPVGRALRSLALAGLGEAPLALRAADALSEGERARLALARALHQTRPGAWVLGDEFARGLDAWTSASIATGLTPWARRARVRLILAGSREELAEAVGPDLLIGAGTPTTWSRTSTKP